MESDETSRRAFIGATVLAWGAGLIGVRLSLNKLLRRPTNAKRAVMPEAVVVFGRGYLSQFPAEADRGYLTNRVRVAMASSGGTSSIAALEAACAADLSAGRLVVIDGWLLPRTEGQICALLALSRRNPE